MIVLFTILLAVSAMSFVYYLNTQMTGRSFCLHGFMNFTKKKIHQCIVAVKMILVSRHSTNNSTEQTKLKLQNTIEELDLSRNKNLILTDNIERLESTKNQLQNDICDLKKNYSKQINLKKNQSVLSDVVIYSFCEEFKQINAIIVDFETQIWRELNKILDRNDCTIFQKNLNDVLEYLLEEPTSQIYLSWYNQMIETSTISGDIVIDLNYKKTDDDRLEFICIQTFENYYRPRIAILFLLAERLRVNTIGIESSNCLLNMITTYLVYFREYKIEVEYFKTLEPIDENKYEKIRIFEPSNFDDSIESNIIYRIQSFAVNSLSLPVIPEKTIIEMKI